MRILLWHVHGSWTTAFVQGSHEFFVPTLPSRGPDGRGRARTYQWPDTVTEVTPAQATELDLDLVLLQRPFELEHLAESWTGRRPGVDIPAVYLEHNTPRAVGDVHPATHSPGVAIVHVTHFNACMWDCGGRPTAVVEHGIVDPGALYTGELARAVAVINEPERRGRMAGTDLVQRLRGDVPLDLFGMCSAGAGGLGELEQGELHQQMALRRVYLHPYRWTSLGLSLVEAMFLGMPVVGLATTAATESVPAAAGVLSCDTERLARALRMFAGDVDAAQAAGQAARAHAVSHFGVDRFLRDWDRVLAGVAA
jgi:hypothetical protein